MDRTTLARRSHAAHGRILAAASYLAERHGLPDEYATLKGAGEPYRDPEIKALFEAEALADFLERMVTGGIVTAKEADTGVNPMSLEALNITPMARGALVAAGLNDVPSAAAFTDDDLLSLSGIGPATVRAIRAAAKGDGA